MKDVFCKFFNFFPPPAQQPKGQNQKFTNFGHDIGQKVANFQHPSAQQQEVSSSPNRQKRRAVQPHCPVPGPL